MQSPDANHSKHNLPCCVPGGMSEAPSPSQNMRPGGKEMVRAWNKQQESSQDTRLVYKSWLLLLVFWYFIFPTPGPKFRASPGNQVNGKLCWSKKLYISPIHKRTQRASNCLRAVLLGELAREGLSWGIPWNPYLGLFSISLTFPAGKANTSPKPDQIDQKKPSLTDKHRSPSKWCLRKPMLLAAHVELLRPQPWQGGSRFSLQMASFTSSNYRSVPKHLNTLHEHTETPLDRLASGSKVYLAILWFKK